MLTFLISSFSAMKRICSSLSPTVRLPVEDGDGCGNSTPFANDLFEALSGFEILWTRQAVSDDG